ncbi:hypothetical protein H5410_000406 [Solanum commersonii]|uniref:Phytocyanin domain-containing protein n=1 Tax=Solanum commersonii TaxID=4109 RepID=A0A9J6AWE8_SOLCO|nr:hypothetical protein H5410_000406 [Solanum commersonii]
MDQLYNEWAAKNRFKVNDTLTFEYKKDSVLAVTQEERVREVQIGAPDLFFEQWKIRIQIGSTRPVLFH